MDPIELGIIGVIVLVVFVMGPKKIPDFAKALGQARREFEQAKRETSGQ